MKKSLFAAVMLVAGSVSAAITIEPFSRTFTKAGGAGTVLTGGSGTWTATTDVDWISIKPRMSGEVGVSCVYVVAKNMTADTRTGVVMVSGNAHTVVQTGYEAAVSPSSVSVGMQGGEGDISVVVDAGVTWSIVCAEPWVTFDSLSGSGNGRVHYSVSPYDGIMSRSLSVQIAGNICVFSQTGKDVNLSSNESYVDSNAGIVEVGVTALDSTKWDVVPQVEWISVVDGNAGKGDALLLIAFAANESFLERTGEVRIGSAVYRIKQKGVEKVVLGLSQETVDANPNGAYGEIQIEATPDGPWQVSSFASWILPVETSGIGSQMLGYVVAPNLTLESRVGDIKISPVCRTQNPDIGAGLVYWNRDKTNGRSEDGNMHYVGSASSSRPDRGVGVFRDWKFDGKTKNYLASETTFFGTVYEDSYFESAEGFTCSFSFQIGELDRINRIVMIGNSGVYLDERNNICVGDHVFSTALSDSNKKYTIAIAQSRDGFTQLYCGEMHDALDLVGVCRLPSFIDYDEVRLYAVVTSSKRQEPTIIFGYSSVPSPGYLSNAEFYDVKVWNRALTPEELRVVNTVDMKGSALGSLKEGRQYYYFPLDANVLALNEDGRTRSLSSSAIMGCGSVTNRLGMSDRALSCSTNSASGFWIWDLKSYFASNDNYRDYVSTNFTCSFWVKIDDIPESGSVILRKEQTVDRTPMKLCVDPNGVMTIEGLRTTIRKGEWNMLTLVGYGSGRFASRPQDNDDSTLTWYVNGSEVGNAFTGSDGFGDFGSEWTDQLGKTYPSSSIFIGGFEGEIDDLLLVRGALSASEIRSLYESSSMSKTLSVTQKYISPALDNEKVDVGSGGGSYSVGLTMGKGVAWTATSNSDWLSIRSRANGAGSATISFDVVANPRAEKRTGALTIAGLTVKVVQEGLAAEVENDTPFPPCEDGGFGFITVTTEAGAIWQAVSDVPWLTIIDEGEHSGTDMIMWAADPYLDVSQSRMGTITVADHKIYITQRGYQLSVEPKDASLPSRGAVGQIGVTTDTETAVWSAQATEDWIHIQGSGIGAGLHGTVRYLLDDNDTGGSRTGSIWVAGVEYVITQSCRVNLNAAVSGHGFVLGGGEYDVNADVELTAVADAGYVFSSWGGDVFGVHTNITVTLDTIKNVTATFIPESAAQQIVKDRGVKMEGLYTKDQMHGLGLGNLVIDVEESTGRARIGVQLLSTSDLVNPIWRPVEDIGVKDLDVGLGGIVGVQVPAHVGARFFKVVSVDGGVNK